MQLNFAYGRSNMLPIQETILFNFYLLVDFFTWFVYLHNFQILIFTFFNKTFSCWIQFVYSPMIIWYKYIYKYESSWQWPVCVVSVEPSTPSVQPGTGHPALGSSVFHAPSASYASQPTKQTNKHLSEHSLSDFASLISYICIKYFHI